MPDTPVIRVQDPLPPVLPRKAKGLEVAEFDTELVVLAVAEQKAHHLQGLAAIVFDACDGRTRSNELALEVAEATGGDVQHALDEIAEVWRTFVRVGLVDGQVPRRR
jgi:hypothetical protein